MLSPIMFLFLIFVFDFFPLRHFFFIPRKLDNTKVKGGIEGLTASHIDHQRILFFSVPHALLLLVEPPTPEPF